jgi:glycosyltransferase involved in cell wall biosynthesis
MSLGRRIAIVSPGFFPRVCGIGDHSARLGDELRRRGHSVTVFSRPPAQRHPEAPELEVYAVAGTLPIMIAQGVASTIAETRPTDVILQYTSQMWDAWRFGSPALSWLAARARQAGARVTLIAHEPFVPWYRRPDLFLGALMQRVHFAALLKCCHHVFVTTDTRLRYVAPYCRGLGLPTPGVIRVGANALPVARADGSNPGSARLGGPRIGVFSTAAVGKRFDVVLDAFSRIAREIASAELVLIGDLGRAESPPVREITDALRRHPAHQRIRVTGQLPLSRIADEVAALDVYLFPMSTGANTRSGTLPVALGSGLPVVAVSGIETDASLFHDGQNIVIARALSGEAFAEATLGLLRDPVLLARISEGARRLYAEHLTWQRIADHLLEVI